MRPAKMTPAHHTDRLAELVCSNSFKSVELTNAHGLLKAEMRRLGSVVLQAADEARVPGGAALAVDRDVFAAAVHRRVAQHHNVTVVRGEATALPAPGIVATGPLTSEALSVAIACPNCQFVGMEAKRTKEGGGGITLKCLKCAFEMPGTEGGAAEPAA